MRNGIFKKKPEALEVHENKNTLHFAENSLIGTFNLVLSGRCLCVVNYFVLLPSSHEMGRELFRFCFLYLISWFINYRTESSLITKSRASGEKLTQ